MKVCIYARNMGEHSSIADQMEELWEFTKKRRMNVIGVSSDDYTDDKQPGLASLVKHIYNGSADTLLVESLDRITSKSTIMLAILELIMKGRLRTIVTPRKKYELGDYPDRYLVLLEMDATIRRKLEAQVRSENVKRGLARKRALLDELAK